VAGTNPGREELEYRRLTMELIPIRGKRSRSDEAGSPLARIRSEIDSVFDRFFRDPWGGSALAPLTAAFPQLDVAETEHEITVRAELPGIKPEDVNIEVTGDVLRLSGEKSEQHEEKSGTFRYTERQFGSFSRAVQLPTAVDANQVDATYKDGVLCIRLPKHPEAKPRRIQVRADQGHADPAASQPTRHAPDAQPPQGRPQGRKT
jgi:HSP20 family protein